MNNPPFIYPAIDVISCLTASFYKQLQDLEEMNLRSFLKQFVVATNSQLVRIDELPQNQCTEWGALVRLCLEKQAIIEAQFATPKVSLQLAQAIAFLDTVVKHYEPHLL